jgi:hypothetical protein
MTEGQNFTTLELEVRQQHSAKDLQPEQASHRPDQAYSVGNVKPPLRVSVIVLCSVKIALHFSCIKSTAPLSRKRPSSELDGPLHLLDQPMIPMIPRGALREPLNSECIHYADEAEPEQKSVRMKTPSESSMHMLHDIYLSNISTAHYASSEEMFSDMFNSPSVDSSNDTRSFAFSSQGSNAPSLEEAVQSSPSGSSSDSHDASMTMLLDSAFRNLICPRPMRTAPGIKPEKCSLEARLTDVAPSIFSPGYKEAIAARMTLVPAVARFLTSFLQKSRNPSASEKKNRLIGQYSGMTWAESHEVVDQSRNEETKLKEVVQTHLWMTMSNGLRDSKPARRLKPLQAFSSPALVKSDKSLGGEDVVHACAACDVSSDNEMLWEGYGTQSEPVCHERGTDDAIQDADEEDEADQYEANLIEEYEDRLIRGLDHCNTDESRLLYNDHDDRFPQRRRLSDENSRQSPSMLEVQETVPHPGRATHFWAVNPAPATSDVSDTPDANSDDRWSNLLNEAEPEVMCETGMIAGPSISTEDAGDVDYEPDFEQWEFDEEQGLDMLFD